MTTTATRSSSGEMEDNRAASDRAVSEGTPSGGEGDRAASEGIPSGEIPSGDLLSILPGTAIGSVETAMQLDLAVRAAKPLILRGLIEQWPALAAGRSSPATLNNYLKSMDRGIPGPVMEAPASTHGRFGYTSDLREFTFSTRQRGISETLDRIERQLDRPQAPIVAIQMLPLATHLPDFVQQNPMSILPQIGPRLWLGGPVKTQIHNDRDHNLACVIAGRRRFLLFPPEQVASLYIGPIDNPPPVSILDVEAPDFARYPRFAQALRSAQVAELRPGDALLVPRHWWHHVTSRDSYNAMVNYWWGAHPQGLENPYDCFLSALLALKDLPRSERIYWQAMFDAYVFQTEGSAIEHIPPELRGALGTMPPGVRAVLKQKLRAAFGSST